MKKAGLAVVIAVALAGSCVYFDDRDRDRLKALCLTFRVGQSVDSVIEAARNDPVAELRPVDMDATEGSFFFVSPAMTTRGKYSCHVDYSAKRVTRVSFFEH
jgi:hypothetical protein